MAAPERLVWAGIGHTAAIFRRAQPRQIAIYLDIRYIAIYMARMRSNTKVLMKHQHKHGYRHGHHHGVEPDSLGELHEGGHHHRAGKHFGERRGRPFNYGEFRLLALAMIAEEPRHGYELMKAVEERMGGAYSPSPGVTYPTLSWLEDMGYASGEADHSGRKRYRITPQGEAFLTANRATVDALLSRIGHRGKGRYEGVPAPILRGMENLKMALRLRMGADSLEQSTVETIAAALDAAAQAVERS
jgi:DNA-binding PadR family transcriptional regulator